MLQRKYAGKNLVCGSNMLKAMPKSGVVHFEDQIPFKILQLEDLFWYTSMKCVRTFLPGDCECLGAGPADWFISLSCTRKCPEILPQQKLVSFKTWFFLDDFGDASSFRNHKIGWFFWNLWRPVEVRSIWSKIVLIITVFATHVARATDLVKHGVLQMICQRYLANIILVNHLFQDRLQGTGKNVPKQRWI